MSSVFFIPTDHWSSREVSREKPSPIAGFTLTKIANGRVLLFGGNTEQGESSELTTSTVGDTVVNMCVCVCLFLSTYIHVYTYIYTYINVHTYIHTYIQVLGEKSFCRT